MGGKRFRVKIEKSMTGLLFINTKILMDMQVNILIL